MSDEFEHHPVMADEIVEAVRLRPARLRARRDARRRRPRVAACSRRIRTCGSSGSIGTGTPSPRRRQRLAEFGDRVATEHLRFDHLDDRHGQASRSTHLSGALFDLGVSSPQLDRAERGFSYRNAAPLDMRMDQREQWTAADIVNGYDDDRARPGPARVTATSASPSRIARAIVAARPIETTTQLAEVVVGAIPAPARRTGGHPAKRTFQALRIELNQELEVLPERARPRDRPHRGRRTDRRALVPLGRGPDREGADAPRRDRRVLVPARAAVRLRRRADRAARPRHPAHAVAPPRRRPTRVRAARACASPSGSRRPAAARRRERADRGARRTRIAVGATARTAPARSPTAATRARSVRAAALRGSRPCTGDAARHAIDPLRTLGSPAHARWCAPPSGIIASPAPTAERSRSCRAAAARRGCSACSCAADRRSRCSAPLRSRRSSPSASSSSTVSTATSSTAREQYEVLRQRACRAALAAAPRRDRQRQPGWSPPTREQPSSSMSPERDRRGPGERRALGVVDRRR